MECNRDEALRAKKIAERKFTAKDFNGAKTFALKAKNLYPELVGISQMLMTLEVYVSAEEQRMPGESNWYGVLGVTPLADDETIRKQYRKLALVLHPDKNRSIGAEGAFQLVSQAWSLLSDKSKRTAYDKNCHRKFQQKNKPKNGTSAPTKQSGFCNFGNTAASQMRPPKNNASKKNPSSASCPYRTKENETFWTVCHRCKVQYEYLRLYCNHNLLCPNCLEAYFAVEINPPKGSKTVVLNGNSQQWGSTRQPGSDALRNNSSSQLWSSGSNRTNKSNQSDFHWVPFSDSPGAQAANMVQQAFQEVKRERQKLQVAARKEEALLRKNLASKRRMNAESSCHLNAAKRCKGAEDSCTYRETMKPGDREYRTDCQASFSFRKQDSVCHVDVKQLLVEKARAEIREKLNKFTSDAMARNVAAEEVHGSTKESRSAIMEDSSTVDVSGSNQNGICESLNTENQVPLHELNRDVSKTCPEREPVEQISVDVVDSDFHDFDKDRRLESFGNDQVWALYDNDDGMPRHYAVIHSVMSLDPFKVRMSWLSSVTHSRFCHLSWYTNGFSKTCGEFRMGKHEIFNSADCFSHMIRRKRRTSNTILIFPRKGEVWALYRNWSPEWNELTEDEVIQKDDMVEVLADHDEELGAIVIPLVKVAGFRAVFHQHFDPSQIRRIPKEEITRFSHQVPSHLLTGQQGSALLNGCLELDPAAIPSEILEAASAKVEVEVERIDFMETEDTESVTEVDGKENIITDMVEGISCVQTREFSLVNPRSSPLAEPQTPGLPRGLGSEPTGEQWQDIGISRINSGYLK